MKVVLDTRFFFAFFNPSSERQRDWCRKIISEASSQGSEVLVSCITITELFENMGNLVGKEVVKIRLTSFLNSKVKFVPVDGAIAELAGTIKLSGNEIPTADSIIASTAILHTQGRMISDDPHFETIKGIKTSWVE